MLNRILCADVRSQVGCEVQLAGWIHQLRILGKIAFLVLRDRSGTVQAVTADPTRLAGLEREMVITLSGRVKAEPQAPGGVELEFLAAEVLSRPTAAIPFEVNRALAKLNLKLESILDHRAFALRNPELAGIFRVQAEIVSAFREFLTGEDFLEVHTPKIVAAGTEGGTALFPVQYFEQRAYLAQSPQFYKQMLVGAGYERVFETGPVYRAEDHATARHINEYLSLDYEMGFITCEQDVMELEGRFLRMLFGRLIERCADEFTRRKIELVPPDLLPQLELAEAIRILKTDFHKDLSDKGDLDPEGERLICQYAHDNLRSDFVFITRYPAAHRPFYTMPDPADPERTLSFDLLYRGLEVTTGSQRIHDAAQLEENIRRFGYDPAQYEFYLEIFRYGMPPHGGLAIGTERLTQQLLGLANVREATFFPRDRFRITP